MNGPPVDRDKVRIVKSADRLKSGVIASEKGNGEVTYRCPCDLCESISEAPFPPKADRPFLCKTCMHLARRGKPGARHEIFKGASSYLTPCDLCGDEERSEFMPKRDRDFLCKLCIKAERDERRAAEREEWHAHVMKQQAEQQAAAEEAGATEQSDPTEQQATERPQSEQRQQHVDMRKAETERPPERAVEQPTPDAPRRRGPARRRKVQRLGHGADQRFLVRCDGCPSEVEVKFVPSEYEAFYCQTCFANEDIAAGLRDNGRKGKPKYDVRTFHNAECAECGKVETVDFRPNPNNPYICDGCFQNRRMRS